MAEFGPPPPYTRDDLIALLRRNFPADYIEPLIADPTSRSLFEGAIAVLLRVQTAGDAATEALYVQTSPAGARATSTVRLRRPTGGAVTITAGTRFFDTRGDIWQAAEFLIAASMVEQTVDVPVETARAGHWLNTYLPPTFRILDPLPDPGLYVIAGVDPATGGLTDVLSLLGRERGYPRLPGETTEEYRARLATLADKVSPLTVMAALLAALAARPISARIVDLVMRYGLRIVREPFREPAQLQADGMDGDEPAFLDVFALDNTTGPLLQSAESATLHLDVVLPPMDATIELAEEQAAMAAWDAINSTRAGGVAFTIYRDAEGILVRAPEGLDAVGDWSTNLGLVTEDDVVGALGGFDADGSYVQSTLGTGGGGAGAAGDLTVSVAALPAEVLAIRHVRLRAWARRGSLTGSAPSVAFVVESPGSAGPVRCLLGGFPLALTTTRWTQLELHLPTDPSTGAAWNLAALQGGALVFGVANTATVGPTDALQVSELVVEVHAEVRLG